MNAMKTPKLMEFYFFIFLCSSLNFVDLFVDPSIINWVANGTVKSFVVHSKNQICLCTNIFLCNSNFPLISGGNLIISLQKPKRNLITKNMTHWLIQLWSHRIWRKNNPSTFSWSWLTSSLRSNVNLSFLFHFSLSSFYLKKKKKVW